jgi:hypothetical protein
MTITVRVQFALALCLVSSPALAQSQTSLLGEIVRHGQTVEVIDDQGRETRGKVGMVSMGILRIVRNGTTSEIPFEHITQITRSADSLANGAWIGFASGAAVGLFGSTAGTSCDYESFCFDGPRYVIGSTLIFGAIGTGIGVGVDALIKHNRIIYRRDAGTQTRVAPVLGPGVNGAMVSVSW